MMQDGQNKLKYTNLGNADIEDAVFGKLINSSHQHHPPMYNNIEYVAKCAESVLA